MKKQNTPYIQFVPGQAIWSDAELQIRNRFIKYRKMFNSEAALVQVTQKIDTAPWFKHLPVQLLPLPQTIAETGADLLIGESPSIVTNRQSATDAFIRRTFLNDFSLETATMLSALGSLFIKVWYDGRVSRISSIDPASVRTYFEYGNLVECCIIEPVSNDTLNNERTQYVVEHHVPGHIYHYCLITKKHEPNCIERKEDITCIESDIPPVEDTGLSYIPIAHFRNLGIPGQWYGRSDYFGKEQLFAEIENIVSMISYVLAENSEPWVLVPNGVINPRTGHFNRADGKWIEKSAGIEQSVDIVSWNAGLTAAFEQLNKLMEMLLFTSRLSPALFSRDKHGSVDSGRALKWRSIPTFSMLNRKRRYFERGLKELLRAGLELDGVSLPADWQVNIHWKDGLPQDHESTAQFYATLVSHGLCSKQTAVQHIFNVSEAAAAKEIERIASEC